MIIGDFNIDFSTSNSVCSHLCDFMSNFSLSQIVDSSTFFSPTGKSSMEHQMRQK